MFVARIDLTDFRNYEAEGVDLAAGVNALIGLNGQGKTNLLEGVHLLAALSSHRTSTVHPMVRHGAERAVVRGRAATQARQVSIDVEVRQGAGIRARINKVAIERRELAEAGIAAVVFSPDDLQLAKGGPELRRRFLDGVAGGIRVLALAERLDFDRVNRQRNGALKAAQSNPKALSSLDVWDEQFIKAAVPVLRSRIGVLDALRERVRRHYHRLAGGGAPELTYVAAWSDGELSDDPDKLADTLGRAMAEARPREVERGSALVGPQRDDLEMSLDGLSLRVFGSQGEQRTLVLALRLAEWDAITEAREESPVLLLDDVFSELDDDRRDRLGELVKESSQTIATATTMDGIPVEVSQVLKIEAGRVRTP